MKEEKKKSPPRFFIALAAGAALALVIALLRGMGGSHTLRQNAGILSDGFFVSGIMLSGVGGLMAISGKTDFFDMFSYGFKSLLVMFTPFKKPENHPRFYEYKMQRREKRKEPRMFLLYAGLTLIAAAVVCLIVYSAA